MFANVSLISIIEYLFPEHILCPPGIIQNEQIVFKKVMTQIYYHQKASKRKDELCEYFLVEIFQGEKYLRRVPKSYDFYGLLEHLKAPLYLVGLRDFLEFKRLKIFKFNLYFK
jgi:hypothetical protein